MRAVRAVTAAALLGASAVVVPVVSVGAAPHTVAPSVERVRMPAGHPVVAGGRGTAGGSAEDLRPVESTLTRDTGGADVVGVTFPDLETARTVSVSVRSRLDGAWGPWTAVGLSDSAPDPDTAEGRAAKVASEPVGVTGSDAVQLRARSTRPTAALDRLSATFVDGGTSAADASLGRMPAASARAAVARPTIVTRAQWGADESLRTCNPSYSSAIKGSVVHHTVNSNTYAASDVPAMLRSIYAYHVKGNGWCDVGYNFFVDRFGRLFEGRYGGMDRNVIGAQAAGFNAQTFGVSSLGNHEPSSTGAVAPSAEVLTAVSKLIAWKASLNGWNPSTSASYTSAGNSKYPAGTVVTKPRVSGHRDFNLTSCPGDYMFDRLSTIRSSALAVYSGVATTTAVPPSTLLETYTRPAGTSFTLAGRGFGHGIGMSQYGAYGAALKGLTRDQILAFYYPGTTRAATVGNPTIRVRLSAQGSGGTRVVHQSGLTVSDGSRTATLSGTNSDGTSRTRWRVVPDGTGLSLQYLQSGTWRGLSGWTVVGAPLSFSNPTRGMVRVAQPDGTQRDYRATVRTARSGSGAMSLSVVPLDSYLRSVVPSEMSPSWPAAALQAQAVAARTFAMHQKAQKAAGSLFDTCDTTACQVYKGYAGYSSTGTRTVYEDDRTTAAVSATTGVGVFYGGAPALTQFGSSNGGRTVASSAPYLVSKNDPYDAVPSGSTSTWTRTLAVASVEKAYPSTGTLKALRIDARDGISAWGGRTTKVTVVGSSGSVTVSGSTFAAAVGLRSRWWTVTSAPAVSAPSFPKDLDGNRTGDLLAVDGSGQLRLLAGNGASGFTARVMAAGWGGVGLVSAVGAWDGDNRHDVVERDGGTLYYHPGNARGGLLPRMRISAGWEDIDLVTGPGDFDGDRYTDLLARNRATSQLVLYRGNGKGGVLGSTVVGTTGWNTLRLIVAPGDVTGDGKADVIGIRASDGAMRLYPGTGTGPFGTPVTIGGNWTAYSALMGPGDVTGDGRADLVGRRSSDGALVVLAGTGTGSFSPASTVTGTATWGTWTRWAP